MKTQSFTQSAFTPLLFLLSGCLLFLSADKLSAQCPAGGITLSSQAAVNAFAVDFPTCTTITESLQIGIEGVPSDITDLTPLSNLTTITEDLRIFDNDLLTSLNGLQNLTQTGTLHIKNNDLLASIAALSGLTEAPFSFPAILIDNNDALTTLNGLQGRTNTVRLFLWGNAVLGSLTGLENLTQATQVTINFNPALTNLSALQNCAVTESLAIVGNTSLTNLNGLNAVTTLIGPFFGGDALTINQNPALTSLNGLNNLTQARGVQIQNNAALTDMSGLDNLTQIVGVISGNLTIRFNNALTSLNGLGSLNSIEKELIIEENPSLTNIMGLSALTNVNSIYLFNNDALTNLAGLNGLTTIPSGIRMITNDGLTSLSGLNNLNFAATFESIGNTTLNNLSALANLNRVANLTFEYNDALTSLSGLSNLDSVTQNLRIANNLSLASLNGLDGLSVCGSLIVVNNAVLPSLSGFVAPANMVQLSISDNPSLVNLNGLESLETTINTVSISSNPSLNTLSALSGLTSVGNFLNIVNNGALTSLTGLSSLTNATNQLYIFGNAALTSLDGLNALTSTKALEITNNGALTSIAALSALTTCEDFFINNNDALTSLNGPSALTTVKRLRVEQNALLPSLNGLNLNAIQTLVYIGYNDVLSDITALNSVSSFTGNSMTIRNNPLLSLCSVPFICGYINAGGVPTIGFNAFGCNTLAQVQSSCAIPPGCTALLSPVNGAGLVCLDAPLSWSPVPNATGYRLRVGTAPGGSDLVNNLDLGNVTGYQHPVDWPLSTAIYVVITPYNNFGNAANCVEESFQTTSGGTQTYYADADGDGYGNAASTVQACAPPPGYVSNSTDCDDSDPNINPGATEVCNGVDDNCNGETDEGVTNTFYADTDGDGYGDPAVTIQACTPPIGYVANNTDCDDSDPDVNPGATEVCNGVDDNCNGETDEGVTNTYYADADGDGYGDPAVTIQACTPPIGYVANNTDCDDSDPDVNPGATEVCNGVDDNCNGETDEGVTNTYYADADGDGYGNAASTVQACAPPSGYVSDSTDCDDNDPDVNPGATEVCNGVDDNCNGETDEGVTNTYYADADGDGYGNAASSVQACAPPSGYVSDNTDCDDSNPNVNPGATEICNGIDDNCNGQIDDGTQTVTWYADADGDGYGNPASTLTSCAPPAGYVLNSTDCDDTNPDINPNTLWYLDADNDNYYSGVAVVQCAAPGAGYKYSGLIGGGDCDDANPNINPGASEICNGTDDDCDGQTDEGVTTTFYADNDNDGFGDPNNAVQACTAPPGYVADNTDLCPTDPAKQNPGACGCGTADVPATWYLDSDGDGFGDPGMSLSGFTCIQPAGYVADNTDLCPTDPAKQKPGACGCGTADVPTTWYLDSDGDGFGDPGMSLSGYTCIQPPGYVADNTDLCPSDPAKQNPGACGCGTADVLTTWYLDSDGDGFGDPGMSLSGYTCIQPAGYVADNTDLCPTDPAKQSPGACGCGTADVPTTWYLDSDGDGFGDPAASLSGYTCIQPPGYVADNTDLCPTDPAKQNPGACGCGTADVPTTWYLDSDGDGFGDPGMSLSGYTCIQPPGYVADNTDLCPTDPAKQSPGVCGCGTADVPATWYLDSDGDGFGDPGMSQPGYTCIQPTGYVANNTDCNDASAMLNPNTTWYRDADNDGYSNGNTLTQCLQPLGYKLPSALIAISGDCNDNDPLINPAAAEVCGNDIDDNCNGEVDEGCCDLAITSVSSTLPSCPGGSDAILTVTATTSYGPANYAISGPVALANATGIFTGLPAGAYTIVVTDERDCEQQSSASVAAGVDIEMPQVSCVNQTLLFNGQDSIALDQNALVTATDNCGILDISLSPGFITSAQVGQVVPVTAAIRDISQNVSTCTSWITVDGLPSGWSQNGEGINCAGGNYIDYHPASGMWTATSTNCAYGPPYDSDVAAFVQRTLCGNGSITVRVVGMNGAGWAGLVMRETNASGAKKVQLMTNLASITRREVRYETNSQAYPQQFPSLNRYWLRLMRQGNQFIGFTSSNGVVWYQVMAVTVHMNSCIQIGLVVTNNNSNSTTSATFSNVSHTGASSPLWAPVASPTPEEGLETPGFHVFPNPTTGEINIELTPYAGRGVRIEVLSLQGQLLKEMEIDEVNQPLERLDLSSFKNGMYLIRVKTPGMADTAQRIILTNM